jgi:hypothetical protein
MNKPDLTTDGKLNSDVVERALGYAHGMFSDPGFELFSPELVAQLGCTPNTLHQADKADVGRIRVLVSFRSEQGDWGLNRAGLDYLATAQRDGKITIGIVVLTADYQTATNAAPITTVMDALRDAPLRQGRRYGYGPYHWANEDLRPAPPRGAGHYITDPDAPF